MGCIRTTTIRKGGDLVVSANRIGGNLSTVTSLVCEVNLAKNYVRVKPEYLWLTKENDNTEIVLVYSDLEWNAK